MPVVQPSVFRLERGTRRLGLEGIASVTAPKFSAADIKHCQEQASNYCSAARSCGASSLDTPSWGLTLYIIYGQSLSVGFEAWPVLRTAPILDVLMMGASIHPNSPAGKTWEPIHGGARPLNPLVQTVRARGTGAILEPSEQAGLQAPAAYPGITPLDTAIEQFRDAWLRKHGRETDPARKLVVAEVGVGGRTAEQLSPGASPDLFNRIRTVIAAAKHQAAALGVSFGVGGLIYIQGEADYFRGTTRAQYTEQLTGLFKAIRVEAAMQTGQTGLLPIWISQTGGQYASDRQELAIANAQLQVADTVPGVFVAASNAPVFDKGRHLSPNGSAWLGYQIGRVMDITQIRGEGWAPTRIIQWMRRGRDVLGLVHTPVAPVAFNEGWVDNAQATPLNRGVRLTDKSGIVPLNGPEIVAPQVIRLTAARDFVGEVKGWVGAKANSNGAISITDSDASPLLGLYTFRPGTGQPDDQNITEIVDKPYQTQNWMVASVQVIPET